MPEQDNQQKTKVIIYGGNGFVGTHVAKALVERACVVCLSRSGHKPLHLKDEAWSEQVRWCKGDAADPDEKLLSTANILICLVGAPPLPTFSDHAYQQAIHQNGITNRNAIEAAARAGIQRVILLGAKIPWPMNNRYFGYAEGKRLAFTAAEEFSQRNDRHCAIVLQPGVIFGTRHNTEGRQIRLEPVMKPFSRVFPGHFVAVERLANRIADLALVSADTLPNFSVISNRAI
ncbi:hypothetical protein GCM10008090_02130 [Arenicella chitinivorans]|uniref:NAD-dependent epimerase/dehydratase domain-containing protein n=1 Tax=Arenicella chitinivorans TaxID=1329800 RepID=A0A918RF04_9GAMM|nr:NAD(P)-dependent oxidoreductase [Arenicella chitinivorans]GGZ97419.1 hypothetical protein GCM10008090_02130 [Arenicella chitinivorans]